MRVTDTLTFLAGSWRLQRSLSDHRSGASGSFTGTARLEPLPGGSAPAAGPGGAALSPAELSYQEEGELRFGEHRGPASRSLIWIGLASGAAQVRFADGRPFCVVDLRPGEWAAGHPCNRDRYLVSYRVLGPDQFEERWQVRGPAKDYHAVAMLTRLPGGCGR
jgi:hypothetical protein